jgi:hypothetical protein
VTSPLRAFIAVTAFLLLLTAALHMFFIVPAYRTLLDGLGVEPSLPSRLAIGVSHGGVLIFAVAVGGLVAAFVRDRRTRGSALLLVLVVLSLASAVYLGLAACVHWDVIQVLRKVQ